MTDQQRPAREQLVETLKPLCPKGWEWIADERTRDENDLTRVAVSQQRIIPGKFGSTAAHRIAFTVTVTVKRNANLAKAEDQLDDDILAVLYALTDAGIQWKDAQKAIIDDRLGYRFELEVQSKKAKE